MCAALLRFAIDDIQIYKCEFRYIAKVQMQFTHFLYNTIWDEEYRNNKISEELEKLLARNVKYFHFFYVRLLHIDGIQRKLLDGKNPETGTICSERNCGKWSRYEVT